MTTTYYLKDTNVDTTCDPSAPSGDYDLGKTVEAGEPGDVSITSTGNYAGVPVFAVEAVWDIDVGGDNPSTGSHDLTINMGGFRDCGVRFQLQQINDSGCGVTNSSSYSSTFTSSGTASFSLSLTWSGGSGDRLRLVLEAYDADGCGPSGCTVAVDSDVLAPWTPVATTTPGWPGSHGGWT